MIIYRSGVSVTAIILLQTGMCVLWLTTVDNSADCTLCLWDISEGVSCDICEMHVFWHQPPCMPHGLIISRELGNMSLTPPTILHLSHTNLLQARFLVSFLISILPSDKKVESQEPLHKSGHECVYLRDFNRAAINGFWSSSKYFQWISSWVTAFCSFFPFSFFPSFVMARACACVLGCSRGGWVGGVY